MATQRAGYAGRPVSRDGDEELLAAQNPPQHPERLPDHCYPATRRMDGTAYLGKSDQERPGRMCAYDNTNSGWRLETIASLAHSAIDISRILCWHWLDAHGAGAGRVVNTVRE